MGRGRAQPPAGRHTARGCQATQGGFANETDQPIGALLADLKQRGMLDETLVVCGGEFGRLPVAQPGAAPGRDHNPNAFTTWFAGGGAKGGVSYGETDELGLRAVRNKVSVHDAACHHPLFAGYRSRTAHR